MLLLLAAVSALIAFSANHTVALMTCIGASALLLALLGLLGDVISRDERTALADLVLLTPLLVPLLRFVA